MYKLVCSELGFDCNFVMKNNDKEIIINNFCKHLITDHNQYYPAKEVSGFIENQNTQYKKQHEDDLESVKANKWFSGRRNFS